MNIHISYGTTARGDVLFLRQIRAGLGARNFGLMPCAALFTSSSRVPFVKFSCHTRPAYTRQLQIYAIGQLQKTSFSTSSRWRSIEGENAGEEKVQATPTTGSKPVYPERMIIYHGGTLRTTFLACLKLSTFFVFGFFDLLMVPSYLAANQPWQQTLFIALCGIVPTAYVHYTTAPYVAAIHIHVPPYARWSRQILERFARTAPPSTKLDITTISAIGKPRVSSMTLGDLRPTRARFGIVNFARDTTKLNSERAWWRWRAVGQFGVQEASQGLNEKRLKNGWVWSLLAETIRNRAGPAKK